VRFQAAGQSIPWRRFDTIVLGRYASYRCESEANLLKKLGLETHFIGDAKQPRHLMYAISEAEEIGRAL
jgi:hypothetical protein